MRAKIERREFITLLGGAAAAWPLPARAQQMARLPTVGFLGAGSPATADVWVSAFTSRLRELGWIEDRNIKIDVRWAEGRSDRSAEIAADLVRLGVDVIATYSTEHTQIVKQVTSTIPIVFALAADPVRSGLVASLAHPGGNLTGLSAQNVDLTGKRFELLREIVPGLRRLAVLFNGNNPTSTIEIDIVRTAANPARGALANDLPHSRICRGWRPDVLWTKLPGLVSVRGVDLAFYLFLTFLSTCWPVR